MEMLKSQRVGATPYRLSWSLCVAIAGALLSDEGSNRFHNFLTSAYVMSEQGFAVLEPLLPGRVLANSHRNAEKLICSPVALSIMPWC